MVSSHAEAEVESSTQDQNDSAVKGHGRIDFGDKLVILFNLYWVRQNILDLFPVLRE